jgi:hypothetical protein
VIDDEKARVIERRVEEEREWLTVEAIAGDASRLRAHRFRS